MDAQRLSQQLTFLLEIDHLKHVVRRCYLLNGQRRENSAEHSWHMAMTAMLLSEHAEDGPDPLRSLKMVLIHDIVEIDAGDTYAYDTAGAVDKRQREERAAERLFGLLPADQGEEFRQLWLEFEAGATPEARFATALDRLLPLLHNCHTGGRSWREHGVTSDQVLERMAAIRPSSERLWQLASSMVADAVARGYLDPPPQA